MVVLLMVTLTAGVAATASAQRLSCALGVNVVVRGGGQEIFGHPVVRPACLKPDLDVTSMRSAAPWGRSGPAALTSAR